VVETSTVEGDWVFRFPRNETAARAIEREFALLPALAARLPLHIPRYEHRSEWSGFPFGGYRYVDGLPVEPGALTVPSIAKQLGVALHALHAFPLELAKARLGIDDPVAAWRTNELTFLAEVRERALPLLSPAVQESANRLLAAVDAVLAKPPALTLVHRDLGLVHILGEGDRITGIIDWSDASIGDPAIDFAAIMSGASVAAIDLLLGYYAPAVDDAFRGRARTWWQLAPFHDILHALDTADPQILAEGIAGVETRLS
jgi:aminoglycoside 2''-phosphotransferase